VVKFLAIRLSSIGDIVLTTPVVRMLKKQVEGAEIHFLTKKKYLKVIEYNPYIDKVWLFDNNLPDLLKVLKEQNFDYIIDLHNNIRTFRIKKALGVLAFSFNKINFAKWLMVNFRINCLPEKHIVDRYLETIRLFDIKDDGEGLDYFLSGEDELFPESVAALIPQEYIVLCIGGQHFTKKMPAEKIAEICNGITLPVIILGGNEDSNEAEKICLLSENQRLINLAGELNLNMSAAVVRKAKVVITHDTGLMHIAAAFKKRIISIWGNTIPAFGMYPYRPGENSYISEVKGLSCRPCSKIGFRKCPKSHFRCMTDQDIQKIISIAMEKGEI